MKSYTFHVYLTGYGETPETAWADAVEGFNAEDQTEVPITYSEEEIDD